MGKLLGRGGLAALIAIVALFAASGSADAAACDFTWTGSTNGDWMTPANWGGTLPTAGSNVCIASGSADLKDTGANAPNLGSLTISGTGALTIQIHQVLVSASTTIGPTASVTLNGTYYGSNAGNASLGGGPVNNAGTITMEGTGYSSTLYGTVTNTGTINVPYGNVSLGQGGNGGIGSLNNEGTINIAAPNPSYPNDPAGITAYGFPITDTSGALNNSGSFTVEGDNGTTGSFTQGGTTMSGNAIGLGRGTSLAFTGTAAASFSLGNAIGVIPMTGNVGPSQSIYVPIGSAVQEPASFTMSGKITLNGNYPGCCGGSPAIITSSGTMTNMGLITATTNDAGPQLAGNVVNNGVITVTPGTTLEQTSGSFVNGGNGTLEPQISSSALGAFIFDNGVGFTAGGSFAPTLENGFTPTNGQEFKVIVGSSLQGKFSSVASGWGADYSQSGEIEADYGATPATPQTAALAGVTGGKGEMILKLSCPSGGSCAGISYKATVTEHLKRGKVTAVTAAAKKKKKATTKVVTIAAGAITNLAGGTTTSVVLKLNATGLRLLKHYRSLLTAVTVSQGGKVVGHSKVRVSRPASTKKK